MKFQIRPAERRDVDELVKLCAAHAQYEQCDYPMHGKKEALDKALFSKYTELKCLIVATEQDLIGYATFIRQFSTWEANYYLYLDCLFIKEKYRGYGIGRQLLNLIKEEAAVLGCYQIQWQTPITNQKAIKFYIREGAYQKDKARFFFEIEH